jgi:hypothetical protein
MDSANIATSKPPAITSIARPVFIVEVWWDWDKGRPCEGVHELVLHFRGATPSDDLAGYALVGALRIVEHRRGVFAIQRSVHLLAQSGADRGNVKGLQAAFEAALVKAGRVNFRAAYVGYVGDTNVTLLIRSSGALGLSCCGRVLRTRSHLRTSSCGSGDRCLAVDDQRVT